MKKTINIGLLLTSLLGYMEWGGQYHSFVYEVEYELFSSIAEKSASMLHPFILLPFIGQVLLLITLFQKTPNKALSIVGLVCLSVIMFFLFFVGIVAANMKIMLFTVPYILVVILFVWYYRKTKKAGRLVVGGTIKTEL